MPEYILVTKEEEYKAAASLFKEYADWLNIDLCFQNFSEELLQLESMYAPPYGGIILAKNENDFHYPGKGRWGRPHHGAAPASVGARR